MSRRVRPGRRWLAPVAALGLALGCASRPVNPPPADPLPGDVAEPYVIGVEYHFDYDAYMVGRAPGTNFLLAPGDVIYVPD